MDNRERARAGDEKHRRQMSLLETQRENLIAVVRRWEMLAASEVKMSGSTWKRKPAGIQWANSFSENIWHFFRKVSRCSRVTTTTKKCTKKYAARAKLFFCHDTYCCCCWSVLLPFSVGSLSNYDDDQNDNFKKQYRFNDRNNNAARAFSTFLWRPLHDYDVKPLNLTTCGGRGHTTTNFPFSFWNWIKSLRIQLQEKSPAFGILSGSK